jgi:hypothetical protein
MVYCVRMLVHQLKVLLVVAALVEVVEIAVTALVWVFEPNISSRS